MDANRFDALTKSFSGRLNRRMLLRLIGLGGGVAVVASINREQSGEAAICRSNGDICRKDGDCCSTSCLNADATGRRRCGCQAPRVTCGSICCATGLVCYNGSCVTPSPTPTATNTPTSTPTLVPPTATNTSTSTPSVVPPTATSTSTSTPSVVPPTATSTATATPDN